jgi:hypothetical protein
MNRNLILLPLLVHIALILLLYIALARAKAKAAATGLVDPVRRALHADAWPDNVIQINNNIRNQFEVPLLFYILMLVLWQLNQTGAVVQALAWLFVASRLVHAYVHTGSNFVPARRGVFMFGTALVLVLTGIAIATVLGS